MTHIREKDEHLDWQAFMNEGLPDDEGHGEYTKALGRRTWGMLHGLAENYGCDTCRQTFITLVSGMHDMVNVHLGKPVKDPARWRKFLELVRSAEEESAALQLAHPQEEETMMMMAMVHP